MTDTDYFTMIILGSMATIFILIMIGLVLLLLKHFLDELGLYDDLKHWLIKKIRNE